MPKHNFSVAVDIVVFSENRESVLLVKRGNPPFKGKWALPGGFVGSKESLEDAARRELKEETGIRVSSLVQVGTFGDPGRDPRGRVVSVTYVCLASGKTGFRASGDAYEAKWFPVSGLPELAFDHMKIMKAALSCLARNKQ